MSSPEINPELQPPAAKKSRGVPVLLNNSSSSTSTMDSNTTTPSGGGGGSTSIGFYNSVDFDGKSSVVPSLLLNNKNKADRQSFVNLPESRSSSLMIPSILPTILTSADEDTAYPQSSPSPASSSTGFLHPSSSPKHITKTETGSLGLEKFRENTQIHEFVWFHEKTETGSLGMEVNKFANVFE